MFAESFTYDDVLLVPQFSEVLPAQVSTQTSLHQRLELSVPLLSAAMDTVTEHAMAIAMARQGGLGVVHKNMTIARQAEEVLLVKKSESGMVTAPITIAPEAKATAALQLLRQHQISGLPVVDQGKLVGIVTLRDLRFVDTHHTVEMLMTRQVVTAPEGVDVAMAKQMLLTHRIEKLPVVDHQQRLLGLITLKDMQKREQFPHANLDDLGRLRVAAAIGCTGEYLERAAALVEAGVDVLVVDTAHAHSRLVLTAAAALKKMHAHTLLMVGNIATAKAVLALADAGADVVKVGIGPGSICTTRVVAGVGVPQFSAVLECANAAKQCGLQVIADGGVRYSGDVVKALAAGAAAVMLGSLLAGCDESPGEILRYQGQSYKSCRGMGSEGAMVAGGFDRYFHSNHPQKWVPEGVEGIVPYVGAASEVIRQLIGGLRAGMGYLGADSLTQLRQRAQFVRISPAGMRESHVHDITVTKEAPNYRT